MNLIHLLQHTQAHPLGSLSSKAAGLRRSVMAAAGGGGITVPTGQQLAVLGGGCFWCLEACYSQLKGVSSAISGYAGGHVDNPTYEQVLLLVLLRVLIVLPVHPP
jgi:Peptide methionine sulfoxide reductase